MLIQVYFNKKGELYMYQGILYIDT